MTCAPRENMQMKKWSDSIQVANRNIIPDHGATAEMYDEVESKADAESNV